MFYVLFFSLNFSLPSLFPSLSRFFSLSLCHPFFSPLPVFSLAHSALNRCVLIVVSFLSFIDISMFFSSSRIVDHATTKVCHAKQCLSNKCFDLSFKSVIQYWYTDWSCRFSIENFICTAAVCQFYLFFCFKVRTEIQPFHN